MDRFLHWPPRLPTWVHSGRRVSPPPAPSPASVSASPVRGPGASAPSHALDTHTHTHTAMRLHRMSAQPIIIVSYAVGWLPLMQLVWKKRHPNDNGCFCICIKPKLLAHACNRIWEQIELSLTDNYIMKVNVLSRKLPSVCICTRWMLQVLGIKIVSVE